MGMGLYDAYDMPDPEEERRKHEAAIAALAAGSGGVLEPTLPVELPEQVSPDTSRVVELPGLEIYSTPEPSGAEIGALPDLPDPQAEGRAHPNAMALPLGDDPRAASFTALAAAGQSRAPAPEPMSTAAPAQPTASAAEPPPPPQQDPFGALMRQGEAQRQRALDLYGENEPGVNGWAVLADVLFNKGKSIPGILQQADNDKRAWRDGRAKLLTGGHNDPVSQALAMERIKVSQGREGRLGENDDAKRARLAQAAEQDKSSADQFRQYAKDNGFYTEAMEGMSYKDLMGMKGFLRTDQDHANAPRIAQDKANERAATTHAGNEADYKDREIKADTAGAVRGAQVDEELRALPERQLTPQQQRSEARADATLEETKRARRAAEGARTDAAKETRRKADADWLDKFAKDTKSLRDMTTYVDVLEKSIAAHEKTKTPVPGMEGLKDPKPDMLRGAMIDYAPDALVSPEDKAKEAEALTNSTAAQALQDFAVKDITGAASTLSEQERTAIRVGAAKGASPSQRKIALQLARKAMQAAWQSRAKSNPELAYGSMAEWTTPESWGVQRAAPSAPAPAPIEQLPVTNQRRSEVPRVDDYLDEDDEDLGVTYGQ